MTTSDFILAILGQGPHSETGLIGRMLTREPGTPSPLKYEGVVIRCKNAITDLLIAKKIEQIAPGVSAYRLVGSVPMESAEDDKPTKRMGKGESGYEKLVREAKSRQEAK